MKDPPWILPAPPKWLRSRIRMGRQKIAKSAIRTLRVLTRLALIQLRAFVVRMKTWINRTFFRPSVFIGLATLAAFAVVPGNTPPISWLPKASESATLLGQLLAAQAAIAALTLAVTLFVLQGIHSREDSDNRTYREYVRQSGVRDILWASIGVITMTGMALFAQQFAGSAPAISDQVPGLRNLTLFGVFGFFASLVLVGALFERAIRLSHPDNWLSLRLAVNMRDIQNSIREFLQIKNGPEAANLSSNPADEGEGSAEEAVRSLLGDARKAMDERRFAHFRKSIDSVKEILEYAMDEIEGAGHEWGLPGSHPAWPPLREVSANLNTLREELFEREDNDYIQELVRLDYWFLATGVRRDCGELFSTAVAGFRASYEIARRSNHDDRLGLFRGLLWQAARGLVADIAPESVNPYLQNLIKEQERWLSDAITDDRFADYSQLHQDFEGFLQSIRFDWVIEGNSSQVSSGLFMQLLQAYRIVLMGLGGRAAILAESDRISDAHPYLEISRVQHPNPRELSNDLAPALASTRSPHPCIWHEWEMDGSMDGKVVGMNPERYPLAFYSVRLMELIGEDDAGINLHGHAKDALSWFEANSQTFHRHVAKTPGVTVAIRCESAKAALRDALRRDEIAEDYQIIRFELSDERIAAFQSEALNSALEADSITESFNAAGALVCAKDDQNGHRLTSLEYSRILPKGPFAKVPKGHRTYYSRFNGGSLGRGYFSAIFGLLCERLDGVPTETALLDTPTALLKAIDEKLEDLQPESEVLILLDGDWTDIWLDIQAQKPESLTSTRIPNQEPFNADHRSLPGSHHRQKLDWRSSAALYRGVWGMGADAALKVQSWTRSASGHKWHLS